MKVQIRQGVFETNSSSTHAICVSKERIDVDSLPNMVITFHHGDYGWEYEELYDLSDRANYLYSATWSITYPDWNYRWDIKGDKLKWCKEHISNLHEKEDILKDILAKYHIGCHFPKEHFDDNGFPLGEVDHYECIKKWVERCLSDEEYLLTYLFGDAFVITGNDNDDDFDDRLYNYSYENGEEVEKIKPEFQDYEIYIKDN